MAANENALNVSVLGAAKEMYIKQLKIALTPLIHEGFVSLWEDAQKKEEEQGGYNYLKQFQIFLKDIPNWNQSILEEETRRITSKIDFLMELVTAIFVSHVKILASVRLGGKNRNIRLKVPMDLVFIHQVYTNAAEMIYYNPQIFQNHTDRESYERIRDLIDKSISETIDSMIPIESVLKEYLSNVFSGHIKAPPMPEPIQEEFSADLTATDIGLPIEESPDNEAFGTGSDPFHDPFPSDIGSRKKDPFAETSTNPFADEEPKSSSSSDPFGGSSDPFASEEPKSSSDDPFASEELKSELKDANNSENDPFAGESKTEEIKDESDPFKIGDDPFGTSGTGKSSSGGGSDPFASSSGDADPFASSSGGGSDDPFASSSGGADPFASSSGDADPFASSSGGADPFASSSGDVDPFAPSGGDVDPFTSNPDDIKVI